MDRGEEHEVEEPTVHVSEPRGCAGGGAPERVPVGGGISADLLDGRNILGEKRSTCLSSVAPKVAHDSRINGRRQLDDHSVRRGRGRANRCEESSNE